jgi:hypothetical protein
MNCIKISYRIVFLSSIALLLLLLYLYRYNFLSADDYGYSPETALGFIDAIKRSANFTIELYGRANGRLVSNFLYSLFLSSRSLLVYKLIPASVYILFCCSFIALFYSLKMRLKDRLYLSVSLLALLFVSANNIHNTFYWMGGIANYFLSLTLFIICISAFIRKITYWSLIIFIPMLLIVGLSNETLTFCAIWFLLILFILSFLINDRYRSTFALVYILVLISMLCIVYISPATTIRAIVEGSHASGDFLWSFCRSFTIALERAGSWLFTPLIPLALLANAILREYELPKYPLVKSTGRKNERFHGIFLFLFAFSIVWAAHFVVAFGKGGSSLPDRAKFMAMFFFMILAFFALLYLFRSCDVNEGLLKGKRIFAVVLFLFILLLPTRNFAPSIMYIGKFGKYYTTLKARYDLLTSSTEDEIHFEPTPLQPPLLRETYFDSVCGENSALSAYYGKKCVSLNGGKDGYMNYTSLYEIISKLDKKNRKKNK